MVHQAGKAGCDAFALPEDSLGLLHWEMANKKALPQVLPVAVGRMLDRWAAPPPPIACPVCSSDTYAPGEKYRNMAFFLGRDGKEIGRYQKVHPAIHESSHRESGRLPF